MMLEIKDTLVSLDLFTQHFCCNLSVCKGNCCIEGDAGAPVEPDEIAALEEAMEIVWDELTPEAQQVLSTQGVVYPDSSGELVISIVKNRDCVFANHDDEGTCYCVLDRAYRQQRIKFQKPISCHLYPVRLKKLSGTIGVNYDQWDICQCGIDLGSKLSLPLYQFLREPLIRRFGQSWWEECNLVYHELLKAGYITSPTPSPRIHHK